MKNSLTSSFLPRTADKVNKHGFMSLAFSSCMIKQGRCTMRVVCDKTLTYLTERIRDAWGTRCLVVGRCGRWSVDMCEWETWISLILTNEHMLCRFCLSYRFDAPIFHDLPSSHAQFTGSLYILTSPGTPIFLTSTPFLNSFREGIFPLLISSAL